MTRARASTRELFFYGAYGAATHAEYMGKEIYERWTRERQAVNCDTCHDADCMYRGKDDRFPADAGGKSQCLRWAQEFGGICWRNPDGRVIIVPDDVVAAIRDA